ncbi:MAG: hypothetical protein QNJ42_25615 [Crocosphaera sp.]|nr:hypothetical protein [Crocosphaera sp.]
MNITKLPNAYFIYLPPDEEVEIPASWVNVNLIKEVEEHPDMITIKFGYQEFGGIEVAYTGKRMKLFKKEFTEFMKQQSQ